MHIILDEGRRPETDGDVRYIHRGCVIAGTRIKSFSIRRLARPLSGDDITWIAQSILTHVMAN